MQVLETCITHGYNRLYVYCKTLRKVPLLSHITHKWTTQPSRGRQPLTLTEQDPRRDSSNISLLHTKEKSELNNEDMCSVTDDLQHTHARKLKSQVLGVLTSETVYTWELKLLVNGVMSKPEPTPPHTDLLFPASCRTRGSTLPPCTWYFSVLGHLCELKFVWVML